MVPHTFYILTDEKPLRRIGRSIQANGRVEWSFVDAVLGYVCNDASWWC